MRRRTRLRAAFVAALGITLVGVGTVSATPGTDTSGKTTVDQRIVPTGSGAFKTLTLGPGEGYTVREDAGAAAQAGRDARRASLAYFGQLSDFQLADEESPSRVEFVDAIDNPSPFTAAWRPWEALNPMIDDETIQQMNQFQAASPVAAAGGARRAMDFVIDTGDSADSQQLNETQWVRTLLEGGPLNPNSGIDPTGYTHQLCPPVLVPGAAEAAAYTGVQDFDDYIEGLSPQFYDPDDLRGAFAHFPGYPGLMDRAQQQFTAAGVDVPSYVSFGNHDALVQGNQAANRAFEDVATGCVKPLQASFVDPRNLAAYLTDLTPANLQGLLASNPLNPGNLMLVPPDPDRRFVSKAEYKQVFQTGTQADGHGFDYIDAAQQTASGGAAGYYSWAPVPGVRFIALDTVADGGVAGPAADGNIDDPQYRWLEGELQAATGRDELIFLFSHHAIPSLTAAIPDELAGPCTVPDSHGHDINPGCDVDPRISAPIHTGADMEALLHQYPHVVAWVAGHSHVNDITPYTGGGSSFWSIRTAAEADWPQQSRLLEVMDNKDGTLSIFGTILDHASAATAPAAGTAAAGMDEEDLASIGRTLSYNDTQSGAAECTPACGEGEADDRNVELLIKDPRTSPGQPGGGGNSGGSGGGSGGNGGGGSGAGCASRLRGTSGGDRLNGTPAADLIVGLRGRDRISGGAGDDCLQGNKGADRIIGGPGADRISGGNRSDAIFSRDGSRDTVKCGAGKRDRVVADKADVLRGCERVKRR